MKDIGWDPIKDIKKIDEFYFPRKIAVLVESIHSENPKTHREIIISNFFGLKFGKFVRKIK